MDNREQRLIENMNKEHFDNYLSNIDNNFILNNKNALNVLKERFKEYVINEIENMEVKNKEHQFIIEKNFRMKYDPTEVYEFVSKQRDNKINEILK